MGGINLGRVFLGGAAAGGLAVAIEYIAFFLGAYEKLGEAAGLPQLGHPSTSAQLAVGSLQILVGGPLAIWLYAAIRPRFGAGPRTALIASVYVWLVMGPYGLSVLSICGLFVSLPLPVIGLLELASFPFIAVCLLAGAAIYQEAAPSARAATA